MIRTGIEKPNKFLLPGEIAITNLDKLNFKTSNGINEEVLTESCIWRSSPESSSKLFGIARSGILFPYFDFHSTVVGCRIRFDEPLVTKDEAPIRYYQRKGSSHTCYFLQKSIPQLLNQNIPLVVTEGEKKLLSIVTPTFRAVALSHLAKDTGDFFFIFFTDQVLPCV